jgi:hypothetical protein
MNRRTRFAMLSSLLAVLVSIAACHGDLNCVTCGDQRTPTPIPPALMDLSGPWTGTIREDAAPCRDDAHPVTAQVEQQGRALKITFSSAGSCSHGEETTYSGTLEAFALSGVISSSRPYKDDACLMGGDAEGTVSEKRIQISGSLAGGKCHSENAINVNVAFNLTR